LTAHECSLAVTRISATKHPGAKPAHSCLGFQHGRPAMPYLYRRLVSGRGHGPSPSPFYPLCLFECTSARGRGRTRVPHPPDHHVSVVPSSLAPLPAQAGSYPRLDHHWSCQIVCRITSLHPTSGIGARQPAPDRLVLFPRSHAGGSRSNMPRIS